MASTSNPHAARNAASCAFSASWYGVATTMRRADRNCSAATMANAVVTEGHRLAALMRMVWNVTPGGSSRVHSASFTVLAGGTMTPSFARQE